MKSFYEEIKYYNFHSTFSENLKKTYKRRLEEFAVYLASETNSKIEEVHFEKIYETISPKGVSLFFSPLDVSLIDQYFLKHLHQSYNWLYQSKCALKDFFKYLYRKYDFPVLTDQMSFVLEDHKQKPSKKEKYVPTRHDLLKLLQVILGESSFLERDILTFILL
ncbi:hypothetical protein ACGTN6_20980, partial [Halomonas sp. THAF12]|uniref:hypothetical protein n=1 Tax=Halomonas sp. B23F22_10 TaxID=3459515 RepID=UPI00373F1726